MFKKIFYIFIPFLIITLVVSQHTALANSLDISRGVMPDSLLYKLDLQLEKIELNNNQNNPESLADLHYQFSTERLNELDYLADEDKANIEQVVVVNTNYQENIQNYSKIISAQDQVSNVDKIVPQIQELQAVQNKIVNKINEKPIEDAVKVIVKSSIKESQDSLIQALATVSKPIIINSADVTNEDSKSKEVTEILDKTITDLKNYQDEVKLDLITEESNLKTKTENPSEVSLDSTASKSEVVEEMPIDNQIVTKIDANSEVITEPETLDNPDLSLETTSPENPSTTTEWYYSSACDYVSETPGKDPVCGGDLVPISTLPADHTFFTKYILKDGKYVQNIDDLANKETSDLTNEITEIIDGIKQEQTTSETNTPVSTDTPIETTTTDTPAVIY